MAMLGFFTSQRIFIFTKKGIENFLQDCGLVSCLNVDFPQGDLDFYGTASSCGHNICAQGMCILLGDVYCLYFNIFFISQPF